LQSEWQSWNDIFQSLVTVFMSPKGGPKAIIPDLRVQTYTRINGTTITAAVTLDFR